MKIGFYGHSSVSLHGDPRSLIDQVEQHFSAEIVHTGKPQCSEERIYHDLKKTRGIPDIALIFHGVPKFSFIPSCNRDLSLKKVPTTKVKYLWNEKEEHWGEAAGTPTSEEFEQDFFGRGDLNLPRDEYYGPGKRIKEVFGDQETFVNAMSIYKEYFWTPELYQNRWDCAMLGIDEFCSTQIPFVIHVRRKGWMPPWYPTLKSGITSEKLNELVWQNKPFHPPYNPDDLNTIVLKNNLSVFQNNEIAKEIIKLITENYKGS